MMYDYIYCIHITAAKYLEIVQAAKMASAKLMMVKESNWIWLPKFARNYRFVWIIMTWWWLLETISFKATGNYLQMLNHHGKLNAFKLKLFQFSFRKIFMHNNWLETDGIMKRFYLRGCFLGKYCLCFQLLWIFKRLII